MSESAHPGSVTETWRPKSGSTPFDNYQLLGVLGQGGMGTVYKAFHLRLKRFVAIKVLRIDQIPGPDLVARFLREMQAVGQMDHPNVVRAADAGKKNGVFYLIMEYLEGADLSRLVAERGPLEAADACELARQTAVGLDYIHQTLVHRDVKPSNLILTTAGVVKILDLGLARLHEIGAAGGEFTPTGSALGTYDYLAPEQAVASSRVDGRADIYSLGCTLFKLLTGRPPFPGPEYASAAQKLHAHGNVPLTAAPNFASIPESLRPVLLRMTAKAPAGRYQTARDVAEALAPFAADSQLVRLLQSAPAATAPLLRPLPARPPENIERLTESPHETPLHIPGAPEFRTPAPRRRRRLPTVAALALGVALLLGLIALLLLRGGWIGAPTTPALDHPPIAPPGPEVDENDMLARRPVLLLPPKRNFQWHYDPGRREFSFLTNDLCLFQLGQAATDDYGFEVELSRTTQADDVGVFFGYRRGPEDGFKDLGRCYAFTIRALNPVVEKRQGAALELFPFRIDFETGQRARMGKLFSVPHDAPPLQDQRVSVQVERGVVTRLAFGRIDLTDQLKSLTPTPELAGGFGVFCERGSGFVRSATLLSPKTEN